MTAVAGGGQPVLVYHRIAHNRRRTAVLVLFTVATLAPFVLGISYMAARIVVAKVRPDSRNVRSAIRSDERLLRRLEESGERSEWSQYLEHDIEHRKAQLAELEAGDWELTRNLLPVFCGALMASLGILFWGIASSPTSRLLDQVGAQPASDREIDARRLLENLAIGAGLPPPKLYVIESSVPNAFAAGIDPHHAVVAVTRGALNLLSDKRELEGVLAHELSHVGNHDIRLNTVVASIALFLRLPYLLFRRELRSGSWRYGGRRSGLGIWELALSPIGLYIVFIAPVLATLLRAAISRQREFLADADAALLTRYPEGLCRALAKIGGAGSSVSGANPAFSHFYFADPAASMSWFSGKLLATHPSITDRIQRLVEFQGAAGLAGLEQAVKEGRQYTQQRAAVSLDDGFQVGTRDELALLNQGNLMGRVYRVLSESAVPVYDQANTTSAVLARVKPGSLIVVFDDPGKMRQVNTADQTFGYLARSVKLAPVNNVIPAEVYDPKLRAAAEAALPPLSAMTMPAQAAVAGGLSRSQICVAIGFGGVVFAAMMMALLLLAK
ncbi:MAG TPA: M48 family metallopeptidase [Candidatus Acidoferrales bacterium]|nr:M48 family metallopeptidase [Candidatus Acidoferrales bacterium]